MEDRRLAWPPWAILVGLYVGAAFVRAGILSSHPYTAEAAHFAIARSLAWPEFPIAFTFGGPGPDYAHLFWQRPLFALLLSPAAWVSFDAYRALHWALASALAPAAAVLARRWGAPALLSAGAGVTVAVHPLLVSWGVIVMPDALMTLALLAAWILRSHAHPVAAAAAFLAATWIKETALVALTATLAWDAWQALRRGAASVWPLRLPPSSTALLGALLLAPLPLLVSLAVGGPFPGWGRGGPWQLVADRSLGSLWLLPLLVAGAAWPRTRPVAAAGLLLPTFFLSYNMLGGRAVEVWYVVPSVVIALVAAAAVLGRAWRHARAGPGARRLAVIGVAVLLAVPLTVQATMRDTDPLKVPLAMPVSRTWLPSTSQVLDQEAQRGDTLFDPLAAWTAEQWSRPFLVDVDWSFAVHPFGSKAQRVHVGSTIAVEAYDQRLDAWVALLEEDASATVVGKAPTPLNEAIRDVYADCVLVDNADFAFLDARACPGRSERLEMAYNDRRQP